MLTLASERFTMLEKTENAMFRVSYRMEPRMEEGRKEAIGAATAAADRKSLRIKRKPLLAHIAFSISNSLLRASE